MREAGGPRGEILARLADGLIVTRRQEIGCVLHHVSQILAA